MFTNQAIFHFYGSLNDFLPFAKKDTNFSYVFKGSPAIKDAIEAIGVPHPEVENILVNNAPVNFLYLLKPGDNIEVFAVSETKKLPSDNALTNAFTNPVCFILDVHLGKLAKSLRMLGF